MRLYETDDVPEQSIDNTRSNSIVTVNGKWTEYRERIEAWRDDMERQLRAENGWLTVVGLYWLQKGENTVGSSPASAVILPAKDIPDRIGSLEFDGSQAVFHVAVDVPVLIDGVPAQTATLRDDHDEQGATMVTLGSLSFYVIRRGESYAVRVKDADNAARQAFQGRAWFPVNTDYRLRGAFHPHPSERQIELETSSRATAVMSNPGVVEFTLHGKTFRLEAFAAKEGQVWIIFRDSTSGDSTYGAGRFVYADVKEDGVVDLDFNKAYHPPCAFTDFATCPLPPKANILPIPIEAGEKCAELALTE